MYIKLNDIVSGDNYILPLLRRPKVAATAGNLRLPVSGWDNDLWQIHNWYRET
jgi:peptide/nickel transport system substrate-binding protein